MTRTITKLLVALACLLSAALVQANTITVTTTADLNGTGSGCSLREAIQASATMQYVGGCPAGSGTDTIQLQNATYALNSSVTITSAVSILGAPTTDNTTINLLTGTTPSRTLPKTPSRWRPG